MSFNGELAGFARGINAGSTLGSRMIEGRINKEKLRKMKPITDAQADAQPGGIPNAGASVTQATASDGKVDNNTKEIAARLKGDLVNDLKISPIAADGIVASLAAESGGFRTLQEINPTVPGSAGGWGYAQWTGPRRKQFEEYAKTNGFDPSSYEANYGFLKQELMGPEGRILKDLEGAKDVNQAINIFTGSAAEKRGFLRPGTPNMDGRYAWGSRLSGIEGTPTVAQAGPSADLAPTAVASKGVVDDSDDDTAPLESDDSGDGGDQQAAFLQPDKIEVTPVEEEVIEAPQVAQAFDPENPYALHAAKGGVIPEFDEGGITDDFMSGINPTNQAAAGEGANQSGIVSPGTSFNGAGGEDNWNIFHSGSGGEGAANQGFNQANNVFTMPQLNDPTPPEPVQEPYQDPVLPAPPPPAVVVTPPTTTTPTPTTPVKTPSQQAYADLNKPKPVVAAPKPAAPKPAAVDERVLRGMYQSYASDFRQQHQPSSRDHWTGRGQQPMSYGDWKKRQGFATGGVIPEYEEGGMVQTFAEGGKTLSFDELLRQEKGDRDRAAKRFNAQKDGPVSSAYDPDGFWEKKAPKSALPNSAPTPTPRPNVEGGKTGSTKADKFKARPNGVPKPAPKTPQEATDNATTLTPRVIKGPQDAIDAAGHGPRKLTSGSEVPPPKAVAAGTPTAGYDPKPAVAPQAPGSTAVKPGDGPLSAGQITRKALGWEEEPPADYEDLETSPGDAMNPGATGADVGAPDPAPVIPDDRATREVADDRAWVDPYIPPPQTPAPTPPSPAPPPGTQVQNQIPRPNPQAALPPQAPPNVPRPVIPEEDRATADRSVQPLPRPNPMDAEPSMPPPAKPRLVTMGSGVAPAVAQRFQQMMEQAGTPEEQKAVARAAVRSGLRFVFDDWGDKNILGYAEGGVVPEEDEEIEPVMQSQHQPNYTTSGPGNPQPSSAQAPAPRETAQIRPTEKMIHTLANAVSTGIDYINQKFSGGGGAIPDGSREGAMRMANGEGAATPEEINAIDDSIDPNREMSESDRHMQRVAKSVTWYLEQGRPEDAAAASASLLMYGAGRAQKLGTLAAAAYQAGDIPKAAKFIEKAYETIPDASSLSIQISPDGNGFVMNREDANGSTEQIPVTADQLPGLIKGMQDNSLYWQQIERLADPTGYHQKQTQAHQDKRDITKREQDLTDKETERQQELTDQGTERKNKLADTEAATKARREEIDIREKNLRERPPKPGTAVPDPEKLNAGRAAYTEIMNGEPEEMRDGTEPEDYSDQTKQWIQKRDQALSRISDAAGKDGGKWIADNIPGSPMDWKYYADPGSGGDGAGAQPVPEGEPFQNASGDWMQKYSNGKYAPAAAPAG